MRPRVLSVNTRSVPVLSLAFRARYSLFVAPLNEVALRPNPNQSRRLLRRLLHGRQVTRGSLGICKSLEGDWRCAWIHGCGFAGVCVVILLPLLLHHLLLLHQHLLLLHLLHLWRLRRLRLLRLRPQYWLRLGALQPTSAAFTAARAATRTPRAARAAASNDELLGRDGVESRQLRRGALSPVHELQFPVRC